MIREQIGRKSKKGAVELSLNLIIMLIIGLVIMGLVIAFVTGFLEDAKGDLDKRLTEQEEVQLKKVKQESGNFVVVPSEVTLKIGNPDGEKFFFKILNSGANELVAAQIKSSGGGGHFTYSVSDGGATPATCIPAVISVLGGFPNMESGEVDSYPLIVRAVEGSDTSPGNCFVTLTVVIGEIKYSEVVTVKVEI